MTDVMAPPAERPVTKTRSRSRPCSLHHALDHLPDRRCFAAAALDIARLEPVEAQLRVVGLLLLRGAAARSRSGPRASTSRSRGRSRPPSGCSRGARRQAAGRFARTSGTWVSILRLPGFDPKPVISRRRLGRGGAFASRAVSADASNFAHRRRCLERLTIVPLKRAMEKSFLLFLIFEGVQGRPENLVAAMHKRNDAMQNDAHWTCRVRKTAI